MAKKVDYDGSTPLSHPEQEFFCELFTTNTLPTFWGKGGACYEFAYGHADKIAKLREGIEGIKKMRGGKSKVECEREIVRISNICRSAASRLLTQPHIKLRNGYLLDQLATNTIVDRELVYLIQQREDSDVKMQAIQHHDKRMQRIREKVDFKHEFEPIAGFTFVRPSDAPVATITKKKSK